jgi:4-amino-4-deoxy-L-arabinose transferase-like glycosyltransferase
MEEKEPSVLDYLKSLLMPWKGGRIRLPEAETDQTETVSAEPEESIQPEGEPEQVETVTGQPGEAIIESTVEEKVEISTQPVVRAQLSRARQHYRWPWLSILALLLALFAQSGFEIINNRSAILGITFYGLATAALIGAIFRKEWQIPDLPEDAPGPMPTSFHGLILIVGGLFTIAAFFAFSNNLFTPTNLILGLLALGYVIMGVFYSSRKLSFMSLWQSTSQSVTKFIRSRPAQTWGIILIVLLLTGLALFFRFYRLNSVPGEMFSDHAEKLLDVSDVLNGKTSIFFPRNTGREAIQFYLTAAIATWFSMGLTYISLKLGTALAGFLTLPYIYLLGKEIGGKRVGLFAIGLAAIAYWPNVIARVGLRFPLYPLFAAPALYYFIRGLRRQNRNDFIWSGVAVGIGLHGYTPFRVMPFVLIVLILLYLLHRQAKGKRRQTLAAFMITGLISIVIFLPLIRYASESPENLANINFRTMSRLGTTEHPYPASPVLIFFENLEKSWLMPFWNDGETWVSSITGRPALDTITAVLYFLGTLIVLIRYLRQRHWIDLFLLAMVPLLMLPSILSLAFPIENPSLTRSGGAIIPVFIMAGIGMEGVLRAIQGKSASKLGLALAILVGGGLFTSSVSQNYDLVFNQYEKQYMSAAWNTSQIGAVIKEFSATIGTPDTAFVIPFPYWVDTRLVGINAGYPTKDYAIPRDQLPGTRDLPAPKLFIYKLEDVQTADELKNIYPTGYSQLVKGDYEGKDFFVFYVLSQ